MAEHRFRHHTKPGHLTSRHDQRFKSFKSFQPNNLGLIRPLADKPFKSCSFRWEGEGGIQRNGQNQDAKIRISKSDASALTLQAAFADINIAKDRSVAPYESPHHLAVSALQAVAVI
jgi:hypothetical protein